MLATGWKWLDLASRLALVVSLGGCGSSGNASRASGSGGSPGSGATVGQGGNGAGGVQSAGGSSGGPSTGGSSTAGGDGGLVIGLQDSGPTGCAAVSAQAQMRPVLLGVMVDRSASWDWTPAVTALKGFFADPRSQGVSASLQFFPFSKDKSTHCDAALYANPAVPMTPLPEPTRFATAIDAVTSDLIGTPTGSALQGTFDYLQSLRPSYPDAQFAVVILTDGDPHECVQNELSNVVALAGTVSSTMPVYVIGYGSLPNLNLIAAAGGTGAAILVDAANPAGAQDAFLAAIESIRFSLVPCDVEIPPPPTGQTFDPMLVNVVFTPAGQSPMQMSLSADCTGDQGWRYDNPDSPTHITLCPTACQSVKSAGNGQLSVEFGCATRIY